MAAAQWVAAQVGDPRVQFPGRIVARSPVSAYALYRTAPSRRAVWTSAGVEPDGAVLARRPVTMTLGSPARRRRRRDGSPRRFDHAECGRRRKGGRAWRLARAGAVCRRGGACAAEAAPRWRVSVPRWWWRARLRARAVAAPRVRPRRRDSLPGLRSRRQTATGPRDPRVGARGLAKPIAARSAIAGIRFSDRQKRAGTCRRSPCGTPGTAGRCGCTPSTPAGGRRPCRPRATGRCS